MTLSVDVTAAFTAPGADAFAVDGEFEVDRGETLVVLGPSGSGKTLLLETVAGFHAHDGHVEMAGTDLAGTPPEDREFGFVFQDYALFPHLTVGENVRYGGRYCEETGDADALLADLGIADLVDRYPGTLSGGEKQRAALARSLYVDPEVLLLDEPLSSLDVPTRTRLRQDVLEMLEDRTAVYVTHDRTTARMLADHVVVMRDGGVVQRGSPADVFERPASSFVARFTGSNCVPLGADGLRAAVDAPPEAEWLAVRPEDVAIGDGDGLAATVERVVQEDAAFRVTLAVDGERLEAFTTDPPTVGSAVDVSFGPSATTLP